MEARVELLHIQSDDLTRTAGIKLDEDSVGYNYMALFEASVRLAKDGKTIDWLSTKIYLRFRFSSYLHKKTGESLSYPSE